MKFLIQIPQLIFGGAEKVLVSFANDLVSRGHEVEILEIYEKGLLKPQFDSRVTFHAICSKEYTQKYYASIKEIKNSVSIVQAISRCYKLLFSKIVGYRRFAEYLAKKHYKNKNYDVAINYLEIESPLFLHSSIKANKYIQWYHTDVANLDKPEDTDKMIPEFSKMDAIVCVANSARESFITRYPQLKDKTHVIYNYFDVDEIIRKGNEPFQYHSEAPMLLSVGRMTDQKKYLRFLDIIHRLKVEGYKFQWHVLGTGYQLEEIKEKIKRLELEDYVFLHGVTDNPYKYMKNCDLFVLPSGCEGFPTVTVEAKILGCAVLATDVSGIREQLVHGESGWIVENSEEAIADGLKLYFDKGFFHMKAIGSLTDILSNDSKYKKLFKLIKEED